MTWKFYSSGLVLLQKQKKSSESFGECIEAPGTLIKEAAVLHKFAEAAYTVHRKHFAN